MDPEALGILAGAVTVGLGQAQVAEGWGSGERSGRSSLRWGGGGGGAGRRCFRAGASQLRLKSPREGNQRPFLEQTGGK